MKIDQKYQGFSLIELMIVVAIIVFLSVLLVPRLSTYVAKAKRTEAYVNLRSLYTAQKAYWAENGKYTDKLSGPDSLNWKPTNSHQYTYGFSSSGQSSIVGSLGAPVSALSGAQVNDKGFVIAAAGDIDSDGNLDVITINQDGVITIVQDDLQ